MYKNIKEAKGVSDESLPEVVASNGQPLAPKKYRDPARVEEDKLAALGKLGSLSIKAAKTLGRLLDSEDEKIQLSAATLILERVYGKPSQTIQSNGSVTIDVAMEREIRAALLGGKLNSGEVIDVAAGTGTDSNDGEDSGKVGANKGRSKVSRRVPRTLFR